VAKDIMGWVAMCICIGLLLPLLGFLYVDILTAKHEVKAQSEKIEQLRREIEKEKRDANTDRPK
jgi:cell division protein FtsB